MDPNAFVAEVYRRMSLRHHADRPKPTYAEIEHDSRVLLAVFEYARLLPADKTAAILDLGFGGGWFIAACLKLGYSNLSGADFGISHKAYVRDWAKGRISLQEIESDIGTFLSAHRNSTTSSICRTSSSTSRSILCSGSWMRSTSL